MAVAPQDFAEWLDQAEVPGHRVTADVRAVLQAVFRFRQEQGADYFSTRLLSHFLLHCDLGLKVAQIARLLGISRPTASEHQGLSSKQVIQQAHHRLDGRPYGKLLPRYAGPIAHFLLTHPLARRAELLDFIAATFGVRVSRIAAYKFLKKYGLDHLHDPALPQGPTSPAPPAGLVEETTPPSPAVPTHPGREASPVLVPAPTLLPLPPSPPFCSGGRNTPAPSC